MFTASGVCRTLPGPARVAAQLPLHEDALIQTRTSGCFSGPGAGARAKPTRQTRQATTLPPRWRPPQNPGAARPGPPASDQATVLIVAKGDLPGVVVSAAMSKSFKLASSQVNRGYSKRPPTIKEGRWLLASLWAMEEHRTIKTAQVVVTEPAGRGLGRMVAVPDDLLCRRERRLRRVVSPIFYQQLASRMRMRRSFRTPARDGMACQGSRGSFRLSLGLHP